MQIAMTVGVEGRRPVMPDACPADYAALICRCWSRDPVARPNFRDVKRELRDLREDAMKDEAVVAAGGIPARRERSITLGEMDALNARRRILREPRTSSRDHTSLRVSPTRKPRRLGIARNRTDSHGIGLVHNADAVRRHPG